MTTVLALPRARRGDFVYNDSLATGYTDATTATHNIAITNPARGNRSILIPTNGQPLRIVHGGLDVSRVTTLRVFVYWAKTGVSLIVTAGNGTDSGTTQITASRAGQWTQVDIPLSSFSLPNSVLRELRFSSASADAVYLDDVSFR